MMEYRSNVEEKLEILRTLALGHRWNSLEDQRVCVICQQIFTGREVKLIRGRWPFHAALPDARLPF
jgi:hypothetical protein